MFTLKRVGNWPLFNVQKKIFLTKCRLVTKHALSITYFHSCHLLTFPFKFHLYKKFKLSIKDYLLLIYMRFVQDNNSKFNNSKVTKSSFLARVQECCGIGTDCPVIYTYYYLVRCIFLVHKCDIFGFCLHWCHAFYELYREICI